MTEQREDVFSMNEKLDYDANCLPSVRLPLCASARPLLNSTQPSSIKLPLVRLCSPSTQLRFTSINHVSGSAERSHPSSHMHFRLTLHPPILRTFSASSALVPPLQAFTKYSYSVASCRNFPYQLISKNPNRSTHEDQTARRHATLFIPIPSTSPSPSPFLSSGALPHSPNITSLHFMSGGEMDYAPWEGKQMGSYGAGAGAAYVFSRSPAAEGYVWAQDQVKATLERWFQYPLEPSRIKSYKG